MEQEQKQKSSQKYKVMHSPWPSALPDGTEIVPEDDEKIWWQRADGRRLFPEGMDPDYDKTLLFRLHRGEWRYWNGE